MTFDLKKGGFDIGIGGPGQADSLFFKDMRIPFIKIVPGDLEAHILHQQIRVPILRSSSPHSAIWATYPYGKLPSLNSFDYRLRSYGYYALEIWKIY